MQMNAQNPPVGARDLNFEPLPWQGVNGDRRSVPIKAFVQVDEPFWLSADTSRCRTLTAVMWPECGLGPRHWGTSRADRQRGPDCLPEERT